MKLSKLINWIWSNKKKEVETIEEVPVYIPYEIGNLIYEETHKCERALFLKMQEENRRNPKIPKRVID